ncbi:DUF3854 domain-containing protein [Diaphorobacter sp. DS2]|uniref:DUF3854 domain-containing protein n=1 Tax=Cytobacillus oceanisediminis TaxID=665099 RepID=A0ABX3CM52_9BACI|nr:DUF3854 domain-containing protein [Cytobacillus oceanisediminis]EFV74949.1 hypothetical protein HMPREF1013_04826 [Bacillus sp. 2_A_57_CT2]OHX44569.1 hypothetical protein BBV17_25430 [Cytobacillus oceanisediminis]TFI49687.1 DUF3854 domain-containing protein [Diaphorobacter sp. DS2]
MGRISEVTIQKVKEVDLVFLAEMLGDPLNKVGHSYFTYRNEGENTPSLAINPTKGIWKDFAGTAGGRDAISYFYYRVKQSNSYPKGMDFIETVEKICELCGITIEYEDGQSREFKQVEYKPREVIVRASDKAPIERLHEVYSSILKELSLHKSHYMHLKEVRKITAPYAKIREYRSFVQDKKERYLKTKAIKRAAGSLEGIPGFAEMKGQYGLYWSMIGRAGMLIPFRNIRNQIAGFQVMYDERPELVTAEGDLRVFMKDYHSFSIIRKSTGEIIGESNRDQLPLTLEFGKIFIKLGPKYGWFSSPINPKKGIYNGAEIGNPIPYHTAVPIQALLNWTLHKNDIHEHMEVDEIWWGEGPLKGDIAADYTNKLHLQVAGVGQWRILLEPTKKLKPKRVVFAFDADAQDKEDTVGLNVTNAVMEAKKELQPIGIDVAIAMWPSHVAKGIDDLFHAGYKPKIIHIP